MATLEITSFTVLGGGYNTVSASFGSQKMEIHLSPDEAHELLARIMEMVQAKQAAMAEEIASARPALLADFTEVDEDIRF